LSSSQEFIISGELIILSLEMSSTQRVAGNLKRREDEKYQCWIVGCALSLISEEADIMRKSFISLVEIWQTPFNLE
jgi:hypothetical protein